MPKVSRKTDLAAKASAKNDSAKILNFNMDDLKVPQPFRMQISGASG
jgi:hypothetical protein